MTEAGIVSTLKRLCEWSGHGGISGLVQLLSVRIRELGGGVLEGILEVVGLVVVVVAGVVVGEWVDVIYAWIRSFDCWD